MQVVVATDIAVVAEADMGLARKARADMVALADRLAQTDQVRWDIAVDEALAWSVLPAVV